RRGETECLARVVAGEDASCPLDGHGEVDLRPARHDHRLLEGDLVRLLVGDVPRAFLHRVRSLPLVEHERLARGEVEAELSALRTEPEAILTAVVVERRPRLPRLDER